MPWNEPGDNNQDPWTGKKRSTGSKASPEELLNSFTKKLNELLGGRSGGSNNSSPSQSPNLKTLGLLAAAGVVAWLAFGIYTVDARQQALVLRFGSYAETTGPGLHWHLPYPIERIEIVDVDQNRSAQDRSTMLTKDENIVDIAVSVQYKVSDPVAYSFNVRNIDSSVDQHGTLYQVLRSSIREVVGRNSMDFILKEGREQIALETQTLMQDILNGYNAGVRIIKVNLTYAEAPTEVKDAFDDANRAREDANRFQNEADAYAKKVVPEARGQAARKLEEANAYREQVTAQAQGDTARFTQLLSEYQKAPIVTRERLYLDTMEKVLTGSRKVLVDNKQQNILYLPIEPGSAVSSLPPPPTPPASFTSQNSDSRGMITSTAPAVTNTSSTRQERNLAPGATREGR
ncbi:FtsH protease activity modulator HflK [Thiofilum flexile]|uniref:FtsH protease activity modulator HflK n=1 Tax=Thiofilum flexile TaxID=125627 RepID=UPI000362C726|nr:FtsH protease activity modulator HflK [Thiofilum flexile]